MRRVFFLHSEVLKAAANIRLMRIETVRPLLSVLVTSFFIIFELCGNDTPEILKFNVLSRLLYFLS